MSITQYRILRRCRALHQGRFGIHGVLDVMDFLSIGVNAVLKTGCNGVQSIKKCLFFFAHKASDLAGTLKLKLYLRRKKQRKRKTMAVVPAMTRAGMKRATDEYQVNLVSYFALMQPPSAHAVAHLNAMMEIGAIVVAKLPSDPPGFSLRRPALLRDAFWDGPECAVMRKK